MKRWICAVLVFLMVIGNASVCHAAGYPQALEENHAQVCELRATGHFSFSVKANGKYYIANALSLEAGDTVRITATYSPASANIYIGLVDENGKFYYVRPSNGQINVTLGIEKRGDYRLAVVNNSTSAVSISGNVHY